MSHSADGEHGNIPPFVKPAMMFDTYIGERYAAHISSLGAHCGILY